MNEQAINSLNKTLTIHFPELMSLAFICMGSELEDKAVPVLVKSLSVLGLKLPQVPEKIVFKSRWLVPGYAPDTTMSLFSIKRIIQM